MKKLNLFVTAVFAMFIAIVGVHADECDATKEAKIGDTCYATLSAAMTAAQENDTITILKNIESGSGYVGYTLKNITIDFNQYTLTLNSNNVMGLLIYSKTTLKNGIIISEAQNNGKVPTAIMLIGGTATLDGMNVTSKNGAAITLYQSTSSLTINSNSVVTGEGESSTIAGFGANTNHVVNVYGTVKHTKSYSGINGGKECQTFNVNVYEGATIEGGENGGAGILQLTEGNINVYGGNISGWSGIVMVNGDLNVKGGNIKGTGNGIPTSSSAAAGSVKDNGAAIYIAPDPDKDMKVDIEDGTLTSTYNAAISATGDNENLVISISGGNFNGSDDKGAIDVAGKTSFISGGKFSSNVGAYLTTGLIQDVHGKVATKTSLKPGIPTQSDTTTDQTEEGNNTLVAPESEGTTANSTTDVKNPDTADNFYSLVSMVTVSAAGLFIAFKKIAVN